MECKIHTNQSVNKYFCHPTPLRLLLNSDAGGGGLTVITADDNQFPVQYDSGKVTAAL